MASATMEVPASGKENTGRWTMEEHKLFLLGLKEHGKQWKGIAALIQTRTVVQIRTHAQKYFQKLAKAQQGAGCETIDPETIMSTTSTAAVRHKKGAFSVSSTTPSLTSPSSWPASAAAAVAAHANAAGVTPSSSSTPFGAAAPQLQQQQSAGTKAQPSATLGTRRGNKRRASAAKLAELRNGKLGSSGGAALAPVKKPASGEKHSPSFPSPTSVGDIAAHVPAAAGAREDDALDWMVQSGDPEGWLTSYWNSPAAASMVDISSVPTVTSESLTDTDSLSPPPSVSARMSAADCSASCDSIHSSPSHDVWSDQDEPSLGLVEQCMDLPFPEFALDVGVETDLSTAANGAGTPITLIRGPSYTSLEDLKVIDGDFASSLIGDDSPFLSACCSGR